MLTRYIVFETKNGDEMLKFLCCLNISSPSLAMKVVELSLYNSSVIHGQALNCFSAARQSSLVNDITSSMWTALKLKQMKITTNFFYLPQCIFVVKGSRVGLIIIRNGWIWKMAILFPMASLPSVAAAIWHHSQSMACTCVENFNDSKASRNPYRAARSI